MSKQRRRGSTAHKSLPQELGALFFAVMVKRHTSFQSSVSEFGLSPMQAKILCSMDPNVPSPMSSVAKTAECGPSNLTGIIDKLEARKLVERVTTPEGDRRVKTLLVTSEGVAVRDEILAQVNEPTAWMLSLPTAEQRQLRDILRKALSFDESAAPAPALAARVKRRT